MLSSSDLTLTISETTVPELHHLLLMLLFFLSYVETRIFWDICQRPCRLYFLYDLFFDLFRFFVCLPGRLRGFGRGTK